MALAGAPFGIGPAALVLALGIGTSRVYLGAHYPLDVAAGVVLGTVAGALSRLGLAVFGILALGLGLAPGGSGIWLG